MLHSFQRQCLKLRITKEGACIQKFYIDGNLLHCEDGPAYSSFAPDGKIIETGWFLNGVHHRDDGPQFALYDKYGNIFYAEYWKNGVLIERSE
jgi:hypothetical protein